MLAVPALVVMVVVVLGATPGCSHDHSTTKTATAAMVAGPQDSHCGTKIVTIDPNVCTASDAGLDSGDGGPAATQSVYGPTMPNGEGDDDQCKYHVKWSTGASSSTATKSLTLRPLHGNESYGGGAEGGDVAFTVTLTSKRDGAPVSGAPIEIEAFLDETHPALNTTQTSKETSPGTYTVGPVRFDVSGKWTIRFHIHDECNGSEASPHGHVAFFAQVTVQ